MSEPAVMPPPDCRCYVAEPNGTTPHCGFIAAMATNPDILPDASGLPQEFRERVAEAFRQNEEFARFMGWRS